MTKIDEAERLYQEAIKEFEDANKELRRLFFTTRDTLHIDGLPEYLDAAREYIDRIRDSAVLKS